MLFFRTAYETVLFTDYGQFYNYLINRSNRTKDVKKISTNRKYQQGNN